MTQDRFQTPPDHEEGYEDQNMTQKKCCTFTNNVCIYRETGSGTTETIMHTTYIFACFLYMDFCFLTVGDKEKDLYHP